MENSDLLECNHRERGRIAFFPVRHHSPTAAYLLEKYISKYQPAAILIEGPADYTDSLSELCLDHQFPIAIYSYVRNERFTRGVFYPFSEHSPEYIAVKSGLELGAHVEFIDLPASEFISKKTHIHRYSDGLMQSPQLLEEFYDCFGVESFDSLWDKLIESNDELTVEQYLSIAHGICLNLRAAFDVDAETIAREKYMASRVLSCLDRVSGLILVVTGGMHSSGILHLLRQPTQSDIPPIADASPTQSTLQKGTVIVGEGAQSTNLSESTLTPFSDARLDAYKGYEAGLPSPGFYYEAWRARLSGHMAATHRILLGRAVEALRRKKQLVSTADVIVAQTMACGLASLRGHKVVFREDVMDGITSALAKDELAFESVHPLVDELRRIFRGNRFGKLSSRTKLPPLTLEILASLAEHDLKIGEGAWELTVNLSEPAERRKSHILHKVRNLSIAGFELNKFSGLGGGEDGMVIEKWKFRESPSFHSSCIEASIWGGNIEEAVRNKLRDNLRSRSPNADTVAHCLTQACLMGLQELSEEFSSEMEAVVNQDGNLLSVVSSLSSLLDLLYYERVLEHRPIKGIRCLLQIGLERALWLLEYQGSAPSMEFVHGIKLIVEIAQLHGKSLGVDLPNICESLGRARLQSGASALIAGAVAGALWKLGAPEKAGIAEGLLEFALPENIGDFVLGILTVAGNMVHSDPLFVSSINSVIEVFSDDDFLTTVPSLRIAFSSYSPREKAILFKTLLKAKGRGQDSGALDLSLEVDPALLFRVMNVENRAREVMKRYGIRRPADDINPIESSEAAGGLES